MHDLGTSNFDHDSVKNEHASMDTYVSASLKRIRSKVNKNKWPKGNDAHLRAIIQSEKKWKHQFFRGLRAANSVVCGRIWLNFKLIQALMYVIITCKYEKDPMKNNREKVATSFFKL